MYLKSLEGCRLAIGSYPIFHYNATNGGGKAFIVTHSKINIKHLRFNPNTFSIPPLDWKTTRILSIPIPPGIKIVMLMDKLEGKLDTKLGLISLNLEARFVLNIGPIFRFPDLLIQTNLSSGKVKSKLYDEHGTPLQKDGKTTLVGTTIIQPTGNKLLDLFLFQLQSQL